MINEKYAICTLFEGSYHLGLGVMTNSLHAMGYRGVIFAGYRGALPPWASEAAQSGDSYREWKVSDGLAIRFIALDTDEHFTNFKPDFMLDLWKNYCPDAEQLFYMDPDIVFRSEWTRFSDWAKLGVAMVEDMKSPIPLSHPLRLKWKALYAEHGIVVAPKENIYVNGGFIGVDLKYRTFLEEWLRVQKIMKKSIGKPDTITILDRWEPFHIPDQDALNITKDIFHHTSIMDKSAMDFGKQGYVMSHAAGSKKPWTRKYLRDIMIYSSAPSSTDKLYWKYASFPIQVYSDTIIMRKRFIIIISSFLGRFISRS